MHQLIKYNKIMYCVEYFKKTEELPWKCESTWLVSDYRMRRIVRLAKHFGYAYNKERKCYFLATRNAQLQIIIRKIK